MRALRFGKFLPPNAGTKGAAGLTVFRKANTVAAFTGVILAAVLVQHQFDAQSISTASSFVLQKGLWGIEPVSLETVRQEAPFKILTPTAPAGTYTLVKSMIAWVHKGEETTSDGEVFVPARQVACLIYKMTNGNYIAVLEVKSRETDATNPNGPTSFNCDQALSEGYFFRNYPIGSTIIGGTAFGTNYLIISMLEDNAWDKFKAALDAKP